MKSCQGLRLDTEQWLWRWQERVAIPPKPYDMLRYLVENPGRLVTQDELLEKPWPDTKRVGQANGAGPRAWP